MKVGVYVGSFNPVHIGHIKVVNYLLDNNYVDKVLMIPTPGYWNKDNLANMEDRVNMLKMYENDRIIIDNVHNNYPYTYQILRSLRKDYNDDFYVIMGSDNLCKLHLWKNIDEILMNKIIVLKRGNIMIECLDKFDKGKFIIIDDFDGIDASSTEVREGNYDLVDDNVYSYIKKHNLYKVGDNRCM